MTVAIRNSQSSDYPGIAGLCAAVYPGSPTWQKDQIQSHLNVFPQGQWVAENTSTKEIVGMAASLILNWDDYDFEENWRDFTDHGMFTNHDPTNGKTLYGAEVMVHPKAQGQGIGKMLYAERRKLVREMKLLRIRAGARLRGYGTYAKEWTPEEYVLRLIRGELFDPTLTFQLKQGFRVLSLVSNYLRHDPESLGFAAVIEWINDDVAKPIDYLRGNPKFKIDGPWSKAK